MADPDTPDSPRRGSQPLPRVAIVIEEHTHSDDELALLARIFGDLKGPEPITSTTRRRLPRG
uniref:hypothetical protein n=1 Tax=Streptomyces sp. NBC_01177 TaxID=2903761 RepID=UPI002F911EF4|nr:hypothetical protein OG284_36990 [Streptomyces sp. NBC_01177]